jgi:lysophospholipase L1-like esterase
MKIVNKTGTEGMAGITSDHPSIRYFGKWNNGSKELITMLMRFEKAMGLAVMVTLLFSFIGCVNHTQINEAGEVPLPFPHVPPDDPALVPVSRPERPGWMDRHNDMVKKVTRNQKIVFIGDSITEFWEDQGISAWGELNTAYDNKITNLGISADKTQHVIWRLENGEFPFGIDPEYVVLLIGTNNYENTPESIAAAIGKIIRIINIRSPLSKIILVSLLPRVGHGSTYTISNNAVNAIIKGYDGYLGVTCLDIAPYYLNSDGTQNETLFVADKVHLESAGYYLWMAKLMEIIE